MIRNARFHHIGIAVASIEKTRCHYESLGYVVSDTVIESVQKVYVAYARKPMSPTIELLQPLNENSPINGILKKNGNTPYHMCWAVDDLQTAIVDLRENGFRMLGKPVPGHGLNDALMVFMYHINFGLIQLMEIICKCPIRK